MVTFNIWSFLDYWIWYWSQPRLLTLVISCNHINPGVLDWVSRGFLWRDTSNLSSFFIFSTSVPLWLSCSFFPVLPSLCLLHLFHPVLLRNLMGKIPWIHGLIDQFLSGEFLTTSINCLLCEFLSPLPIQDIDNLFQSKHAIATLSKTRGCPDDTVYIDQLCSFISPQCCLLYLTFSTIDKLRQGEDMFSNGK